MEVFESLTADQKSEVINKDGQHIVSITHGPHCISLFLLEDVFAERYYNTDNCQVDRISLVSDSEIDKYLDYISIGHLL